MKTDNRNKKLPVRKNTRLINWDYSSSGAYFVTFCSRFHKNIFSRVVVGAIHESPEEYQAFLYDYSETYLTDCGKTVQYFINRVPERFNVYISDFVIMPNHIHMVIWINERAIRESPLQSRSVISNIVGYIKMNSSKEIHKAFPEMSVWQRNYHDHIIRDEKEYLSIAEYIFNNPGKWNEDCFFNSDNG